MNNPNAKQAAHRYKRATLARMLLQEHIKGNLDSTVHLSWDVLDALPDWFAMNQPERMQLQLISGAYLLAPAMQLWIDRRVIQPAIAIIGEKAFTDALAYKREPAFPTCDLVDVENDNAFSGDAFGSNTFNNNEQYQHSVHVAFEQAGKLVLKASLPTKTQESLSKLLCPESRGPEKVALRDGLLSNSLCIALIEQALNHVEPTGISNSEDPPAGTGLTGQSIHNNLFNGDAVLGGAVRGDHRGDSTAGSPL